MSGMLWISQKPTVIFHTFTLEIAEHSHEGGTCIYLRSAPVRINHKIRGAVEVSHRSSSGLLILSASTAPTHRPHPAHSICIRRACSRADKGTVGECLPAKAMSLTPSWALSTAKASLGEITRLALNRFETLKFSDCKLQSVQKRAGKNKGFSVRSWNHSQILIRCRF